MAINLLDKYIANDFADFAGLQVTGSLPVKQEILNDLLQSVLKDLQQPAEPAAKPAAKAPVSPAASDKPGLDPRSLLKFVKKAELRAETGRIVFDFEVGVDAPAK